MERSIINYLCKAAAVVDNRRGNNYERTYSMTDLTKLLYFFNSILSILVLFDLIIRFKRPRLLKLFFFLLISSTGAICFTSYLGLHTLQNMFIAIVAKSLVAASIINIFSIIYYPLVKRWVVFYSILLVVFTCFSLWYNTYIEHYYLQNIQHNVMMGSDAGLPFIFVWLHRALLFGYFMLFIFLWYQMIKKYSSENIYFEKIKKWSTLVLVEIIVVFILYIPLPYLSNWKELGDYSTILLSLYNLLLIFYRPTFLNNASLKITLGDSFNKEKNTSFKESDFVNAFYTDLYFINNDASMEKLAKKLNVSTNDLYKYVYYKYSMTFNDLLNKSRVDYFIELIDSKKFSLYTIEALAREAGFTSRQHLYKPFRKFHGGSPSEYIDSIK